MKDGITYNDVRNALELLKNEIPATDEVCTRYTVNTGYSGDGDLREPFYFMNVKCGKIWISLKVYGTMLVSESDEQLEKGE